MNGSVEPCREARASFCERSFFTWVNPIVKLASNKVLSQEDLPDIMDTDKSNAQRLQFKKEWDKLLKTHGDKATIVDVLKKVYGRPFAIAGIVKLWHDILQYLAPVLLSMIIGFIEDGGTAVISIFGWNAPAGLVYVFLLFLGQIVQNFFLNNYFHRVYRVGMQARAFVISAIYDKSLRVTMSEQHGSSTGSIVNLMSNDTERIQRVTSYGHNIWSAPFQVIVAFALLMVYIGPSALVGIFVMIVSVPAKKYLAKKLGQLRVKVVKTTEHRVKLINDVLQGMRVIKLYAWENSFLKMIQSVRQKEMDLLNKTIVTDSVSRTMWNLTPLLVAMSTFAVYAASGGQMKASLIFTALSLFTRMRFPLTVFPMIITSLIDFFVASRRITKFLHQTEVKGLNILPLLTTDGKSTAKVSVEGNASYSYTRKVADTGENEDKDAKNDIESKQFKLKNINMSLSSGQLCMVCGKVGSGKSSLVSAILGEMHSQTDSVIEMHGSVAYVPQSPWILNKSVRQNVVLQADQAASVNEARYQDSLVATELINDLHILPAGDQTEIGEKGINISGGQKQRVALARAVYADRDIYILDDPLSALDVHVGQNVFDHLIKDRLREKLVILVTHNLLLLPDADHILYLENGDLVGSGKYDDLLENSQSFRTLISSMEDKHVGENVEAVKDADRSPVSPSTIKVKETETSSVSRKTGKGHSPSLASKIPLHETTEEERKAGAKMIRAEQRSKGSLKLSTVAAYFGSFYRGISASFAVVIIVFLMSLAESCNMLTSWWLSHWSTSVELAISGYQDHAFYIGIYGCFVLGALILYFISQIVTSEGAVAAATRLHDRMLHALLAAPMRFFETTPTGRTLSRCSKDVDEADTLLRVAFSSMFTCFIESSATLVLVTVLTNGWLAVVLLPIGFLYFYILNYYRKTSRELKRLDSVSKSPVFSHFAETLNGLTSVRAFQMEEPFGKKNLDIIDVNHRAYFLSNVANRWLSIRLELIGGTLTLLTGVILVFISSPTTAALAGLALVYITKMLNTLNWGVRQVSETEVRFNAVERLLEYQGDDFPTEAPSEMLSDSALVGGTKGSAEGKSWPLHGEIKLINYSMRYREKLPLVLRNLNATVPAGSRVGICGRTGSGKSSLFSAIFRLVEPAEGSIEIDGQDITSLGLKTLRSKIAIIPQDPVLFVGNVRDNLDPFGTYSDAEIWEVLRLCNMFDVLQRRGVGESSTEVKLMAPVSEGGSNFSQGERQLMCIARALLRKPKVLLLDEATASIDMDTDNIVQEMIRKIFCDCTTLTIAHRINTIADSDLIMVLDNGTIQEFDTPAKLLEAQGLYYEMLHSSGEK